VVGVPPWQRAAFGVLLCDRATSEPVVEQGHSCRERKTQQVRHFDFGGDAAAAAQENPGQLPKRPKEVSKVRGGEDGPAGVEVSLMQLGHVMQIVAVKTACGCYQPACRLVIESARRGSLQFGRTKWHV
jgi:hypothetical protein